MKQYTVDRLTKEEIFGGKIIVPYREWLKSHKQETKGHNYRADMAIITHYLQNKNYPEGELYHNEALPLMEHYYRAVHPDLDEDEEVALEQIEKLFANIYDTPVYGQHRENNAFTFIVKIPFHNYKTL